MEENLHPRINFWLTEVEPDCMFVVGPENGATERIGALKILLMGDSEPFRAMLKDSALAEKGDIRITDIEPDTFRCFLKCVYGGSSVLVPKLTFEECAKLFYVTKKYLVDYISAEVAKRMKKIFSDEHIFVALSHPVCYHELSLRKKILEILQFDFEKVTEHDQFLDLSSSSIAWIVQQHSFIVEEVEIWKAILKWARHKTSSSEGAVLRAQILNFLKEIRFLAMSFADFWKVVVPSGILEKEEIYDICKSLGTDTRCSIDYLNSCRHSRYSRQSGPILTTFTETPTCVFIRYTVSSVIDSPAETDFVSDTCRWGGHLWELEVIPNDCVSFIDEGDSCLSAFLSCRGLTYKWSCQVEVEVNLINQIGKCSLTKCFTKTFSQCDGCLEMFEFYKWEALINPSNGFIRDNTMILTVKIQLKNV